MNKHIKGSQEPSLTGLPPTKVNKGVNNDGKTSNPSSNISNPRPIDLKKGK
ncbi:hypothetical protein [Exiguobacterium sp. s22]|uniref:hypothetical protein n=1 Tax=Exiguobacterium sp. s22 TaxID=2751272 RepID=UPI001BE7794B|nr:hypothetical protein [Exiguobacterium sp. s22]